MKGILKPITRNKIFNVEYYMCSERISDTILRKATEIINEPYSHGPFGRMWLWWAAMCNLFLGSIMVLSTRWNIFVQKEICILTLGVYLIMYVSMLIGARKQKYGRGIYITHILWLAQIIWGAWVIITCDK